MLYCGSFSSTQFSLEMCFIFKPITRGITKTVQNIHKLVMCIALLAILVCLVVTLLLMLYTGVGLGYNMCYVQLHSTSTSQPTNVTTNSPTPLNNGTTKSPLNLRRMADDDDASLAANHTDLSGNDTKVVGKVLSQPNPLFFGPLYPPKWPDMVDKQDSLIRIYAPAETSWVLVTPKTTVILELPEPTRVFGPKITNGLLKPLKESGVVGPPYFSPFHTTWAFLPFDTEATDFQYTKSWRFRDFTPSTRTTSFTGFAHGRYKRPIGRNGHVDRRKLVISESSNKKRRSTIAPEASLPAVADAAMPRWLQRLVQARTNTSSHSLTPSVP